MEEVTVLIFIQHLSVYTFLSLRRRLLFVDEVGAIVFDVGAQSVRAGYAGEDCPKVHVISFILFPFLPLLVIRYLVRRH